MEQYRSDNFKIGEYIWVRYGSKERQCLLVHDKGAKYNLKIIDIETSKVIPTESSIKDPQNIRRDEIQIMLSDRHNVFEKVIVEKHLHPFYGVCPKCGNKEDVTEMAIHTEVVTTCSGCNTKFIATA